MSDMPARTFNEADRSQRGHSQHRSTSNKWTPHTGSTSVSHPTSTTAGSKYGPHAGPVSPRTPHKRPWDASDEHSVTATGPDSAEEDELRDEISPVLHGDHGPYRSQRKDPKDGSILPSPKRSKRGAVEPSSTMRVSCSSAHRPPPGSKLPYLHCCVHGMTDTSHFLLASVSFIRILNSHLLHRTPKECIAERRLRKRNRLRLPLIAPKEQPAPKLPIGCCRWTKPIRSLISSTSTIQNR